MTAVKFVFTIHCHQPIGNFDFVFEDSYNRCYHPFLETLNVFPDFKCCLHYTGILLEWIEKNHPEHLELIKSMVSRGQLEMLSGGYYEPVLAVIPDEDKIGQIEKLSRMIKVKTGKKPRGMWLAERVWEPHLPSPLSKSGMEYVVVDDTHFKYSGLEDNQLDGYYIAEETGDILRVFPSSKFLRYSIPFKDSKKSTDYLHGFQGNSDNPVIVYADDAEKFGIWPGTHELCYKKKWLANFFKTVLNSSDYIQTAHFSEVIDNIPPKGNIYLPTASYAEMMEWSLPSRATISYQDFEKQLKDSGLYEKYSIFVRGGFWRNFLANYPESNYIHKKMLWVHEKIKNAQSDSLPKRKQKYLVDATDEKRKGQCNDPYWHGVFGGLYLNNLRTAVYKHLITADNFVDKAIHNGGTWIDSYKLDYDRDGRKEFLVETPHINIYLSPARGGSVFELDYKDIQYNFCNLLTRREEPYHRQIIENVSKKPSDDNAVSIHDLAVSKEKGLDKFLKYDWYRRAFLIDHFFGNDTTFESFADCSYPEKGDFVEQEYTLKYKELKNLIRIILSRNGHVWVGEKWCPVTVEKQVNVPVNPAKITIQYSIINHYTEDIPLWFGSECNLSMLDGQSEDRYYFIGGRDINPKNLASLHQLEDIDEFGVEDRYLKVRCKFQTKRKADLWLFPIQTVSLSEAGFEKVYQSSVLLPHWKFNLPANKSEKLEFSFSLEPL